MKSTPRACVLLAAIALAPASAEAGVFRIVSIDSKVTESNSTWSRHAWVLTVRNAGMGDLTCDGAIQWLDRGGFVVDDDKVRFQIAGNQTLTFRDYALISRGPSDTVREVNAAIDCDPIE